ncbi:triose-phosphate isomerase [Phytoactinopolyspora endophytica]|uniref:triose-phosphate isomerase n=1 Tax=Phytoactinopolyspora endophytica TaxID=1642495 RepID=UPI00101DA9FB|nr:triose-phosphate isomerase [Phytoactinopolyspora endophytica]
MTGTWVGTSWKMTKTLAEARDYCARLATVAPERWPGLTPFVLPPATALATVVDALGPGSPIVVGAQNAHWEDAGAWTGEVSVPQIADAGARIVEIGHSERRTHFGETDGSVNCKIEAALRHGVRPLVCVGEGDDVFRAGGSVEFVCAQVDAALDGLGDVVDVLVAYEPVWAIGTSGRPARPDEVAPVFNALRREYKGRLAGLLYGGSVTGDNARDLLDVPGNDGLFIGRAAWDVENFIRILDLASQHRAVPAAAPPTL